MNLSELPALKARRDKLARGLHERRGGDYLACMTEANDTVRRAYRSALAESTGRRPAKPLKKARRKARESLIREVAGEAAGRAVRETLARAAQQPPVPAARPVHEMDETGLAEAIGTAAADGMISPFWTVQEAAPAPLAAPPAPPPDKPLHELDWETADDVIAARLGSYGQQAGLVSPFWAGSDG